MAVSRKISQLNPASAVTGAELVPIVQSGETRKAILANLWPLNQTIVANNSTAGVGYVVYVSGMSSGGLPTVDVADVSDINKMPAIGIVTAVINPIQVAVLIYGIYQKPGFTPNARYWVSATGTLSTTPPASGYHQTFGQALDENTLIVKPSLELYRRLLWKT